MTAKRIFRIFLALIVLAIFGVYTYVRVSYSPRTRDLGPSGQLYNPYARTAPVPPLDPIIGTRFGNVPVEVTPAPAPTASPVPQATEQPKETEQPGQLQSEQPSPTPEPTPEPTLDPNTPAGRAAALGLPEPPDIDVNSWEFVLANVDHPLDANFAPPVVLLVSDSQCPQDSRIVDALTAFANDCKAAGYPVLLSSGYRSYYEQQQNFQRVCQNNGITDGKDADGNYITLPAGASEHQTGLCCDMTDHYRNPKVPSEVEQTETFQWLKAHCTDYGFILRYPDGRQDVTGVMYEPWHFRYVGRLAAEYITENNLVLEEFLALYGVE